MNGGEWIAGVLVALLSLYGCAALIRRLCLWFTRCPGCCFCCRLAVPRNQAALAPLLRCLQSQAVWDDPAVCRQTLMLLPEGMTESGEEMEKLLCQAPAVVPVTATQLMEMLELLMRECE